MLKEVKQSYLFLEKEDKKKLIFLSLNKFFTGLLDFIGIISVLPILAIVANQNLINENRYLIYLKELLNLNDKNLLILLIIVSISLLIINYSFRLLDQWYDAYVGLQIWKNLSSKLFKYYLNQDYNYHLINSTNSLLERLNVKVNFIVIGIIQPFFQIIGKSFSSILIFLILIIAQPKPTIILTLVVFLFFQIVYLTIKKKVEKYGKIGAQASKHEFKIIDQALKSIKDIKINQTFDFYKNYYRRYLENNANSSVKKVLYIAFPKIFLELIAYFLVYIFVIYMLFVENTKLPEIAVIIGIYLIALQRILPNAQIIFSELSNYKFYKYAHHEIFSDFENMKINDNSENAKNSLPLKFEKAIKINKLNFSYEPSKSFNLNINELKIEAKNFIGICGKSGSGKSTFINLVTGLLKSNNNGTIFIDEQKLSKNNLINWQKNIAYVPQSSFIADDTIKNNIAYGFSDKDINLSKVENAAKISKLDDFINDQLNLKYNTLVGESGVRLSGGQKQRISIARALYLDRKIIILDESTSSLDLPTEQEILNSLLSAKKNKTLIFITHRVLSLKECDNIILFNEGRIEAVDNYKNLIKSSTIFNNLIKENLKDK